MSYASCDPGTAAHVFKDASQDAVGPVATRTSLGVAVLRSGAAEAAAHCLSGRLVRAFSVKQEHDGPTGARGRGGALVGRAGIRSTSRTTSRDQGLGWM